MYCWEQLTILTQLQVALLRTAYNVDLQAPLRVFTAQAIPSCQYVASAVQILPPTVSQIVYNMYRGASGPADIPPPMLMIILKFNSLLRGWPSGCLRFQSFQPIEWRHKSPWWQHYSTHVLDVFKTKKTYAFAKNYHRTSYLGDEGHFCNQIFKVLIFDKAGTQWTQDKGWRLSPKYFGSGACAPDDFEKETKPN